MNAAQGGNRRMLVVLGAHRSGTSAAAGLLSHLGVDFSDRLIAAAEDNPKGFFEHAEAWQLDHSILRAMGSDWDDPLPLPEDWQEQPAVHEAGARIRTLLKRDFAGSVVAGIKDPRMCRLMPAWRQWLAQEGFAPQVLLVVRRPEEVIASLVERDDLPEQQAAWMWLRHVLESEAATRDLPRVVVPYVDLLRDWRALAEHIGRRFDLVWPRNPAEAASAVVAFLDGSLRHHAGASLTHALRAPLQGWLGAAYNAVTRAEGIDEVALDQVAREVSEFDEKAGGYAVTLRRARLSVLKIEKSLQWADDERQRVIAAHAELSAGNASLRENVDRHAAELARMAAGNAQLREGNAALRADLDNRDAELSRMAAGNAELREANAALRGDLDNQVAELSRMSRASTQLREELDRTLAERAQLAGNLEQSVSRGAALAGELGSVYASKSWRVTRPLRGAIRHGRRLAGLPESALNVAERAGTVESASMPAAPTITESPSNLDATFRAATGPRILIVTPDILGPIRNGGIGTAFGTLAQTLARAGHAVTILYTLGGFSEDGGEIARWEHQYAALGMRFVPIYLEQGEQTLSAPHYAWRSYRIYQWLSAHQQDYDLAYFPEWRGEAYYALQAKHVGIDFARLRMIVVTHSSTTWAESGNYAVPQQTDDLMLEFMERRVTEMADAVVSPSQYMVDWMKQRGWRWSAPTYVIQNLMPDAPVDAPQGAAPAFEVTEWVFFGRLEQRKGLLIFLDALNQMPQDVRQRIRVTLLGKAVRTAHFDSLAVIEQKLAGWPQAVNVIVDYDRDRALEYLQVHGRVAVIASLVENLPYTVLECVLRRIPFIAADVGGIAELVHPDDRAKAMFKPTPAALARTLLALEGGCYAPPRPAVPAAVTEQRWLSLQQQLLGEDRPQRVVPAPEPLRISVCLVHYNRPAMLAQAIDSLRQQTYTDFDVVLVDDGSPSPEAQQYLRSLQDEFAWRGWTIVRQDNAYLGAARNAAARQARGEYLLFMDDDNLAKPEELDVFARAARHTDADILTTVSDVFTDAEGGSPLPQVSRELWIPLGNAPGPGVFRNVFGDANALVRRSTFEALGGFTEDYGVGHEDWEFFARAVLAGANLQLIPQPLFWYRVSAGGMLRAGRSHLDHARSVRPYWEGLHGGIGAALAYASYMHRYPVQYAAHEVAARQGRRSRLLMAATGIFRPQVRATVKESLRLFGWRGTIGRSLRYIVPSRNKR